MATLETADLHHTAILWEIDGHDSEGNPLRGQPEEIDVRWTWLVEDLIDATGQKLTSVARVAVNQEIPVGSWMWKGELEDWYFSGSAGPGTNLMQVVDYRESDDIKGIETRRLVRLIRFRDTPPAFSS